MPKSNKAASTDELDAVNGAAIGGPALSADRLERRIVWSIVAAAMILTTLPFAWGMFNSFPDYRYVGQVYNIDDYMVYASWTRQVADGHFFLRNLFTTDPQLGRQVNLYYLLLGWTVRLTHMPIAWAIEMTRFIGGIALLRLIYRFYRVTLTESVTARLVAFALSALGTGFGWVYARVWWNANRLFLPVDSWQPEAFTFLSLTASALFVVSTLLIVATILLLLESERRRQARWAVAAGVCGLVIGNVHSYDIIHVVGAWGLFLIVRDIVSRKFHGDSWVRAVIAGVITIPTVAYQYHLFKHDPAFHARVDTATHSMSPWTYVFGYGLTFMLAVVGAVLAFASARFASLWRDRESMLLPVCWIVAAFALVYVPSSFQRKMIMGVDIPLALVAGAALVFITAGLAAAPRRLAIAAALLVSLPTGLLFVGRDLRHISSNSSETSAFPFLSKDELQLFGWIRENTDPSDVLLGPPNLMLYVPGYCDRMVWCGHWGETSDYQGKYALYAHFSKPMTSDDYRRAFLRSTGARYLVALRETPEFPGSEQNGVPYLSPVYTNDGYVVYAIHPNAGLLASAR